MLSERKKAQIQKTLVDISDIKSALWCAIFFFYIPEPLGYYFQQPIYGYPR